MVHRSPPWLEPAPPWLAHSSASALAGAGLQPSEVPLVELLSAPCTLAEVVALRGARFVPLYGLGARKDEAVRLLANLCRALGGDADPRGVDHALTLTMHPQLGVLPLQFIAQGARDGSADAMWARAALAYVCVLGAGDAMREQLARELTEVPGMEREALLAVNVSGGDYGTYREHYAALAHGDSQADPASRVARSFFDWVLARRFGGLDALAAQGSEPSSLDLPSRWLIAAAEWVAGDESARGRMTDLAQQSLASINDAAVRFPRLLSAVAREMTALLQQPLALRAAHLRCAAIRDHAAMSIRAWLSAAIEPDTEDLLGDASAGSLSPELSRAGRAANEARAAAGDFLLDWFVADREAREVVDTFARGALRVYHRLRGATMLAAVDEALRPVPVGARTKHERLVWGPEAR